MVHGGEMCTSLSFDAHTKITPDSESLRKELPENDI